MAYVRDLAGFSLWSLTSPIKLSVGLMIAASGLIETAQLLLF